MAPKIFFRVHDRACRTSLCDCGAFQAGDPNLSVQLFPDNKPEFHRLKNTVRQHLDWGNRTPSPFISVYDDFDAAKREAKARAWARERKGVTLTKIDITGLEVKFRNMQGLIGYLGLSPSDEILKSTEHEYIFLRTIPTNSVVKIWKY